LHHPGLETTNMCQTIPLNTTPVATNTRETPAVLRSKPLSDGSSSLNPRSDIELHAADSVNSVLHGRMQSMPMCPPNASHSRMPPPPKTSSTRFRNVMTSS